MTLFWNLKLRIIAFSNLSRNVEREHGGNKPKVDVSK